MTNNSPLDNQDQFESSAGSSPGSKFSRGVPLWQAMILPIASIVIFALLLEGGLALFGLKPALQSEDPFVGFASNVPLFIPDPREPDGQILTTAPNKLGFFNSQSFQREKPSGTFRIFCLGGSTTYGRPYNDLTSFSGWLREILPLADTSKKWEVINAGGISYASYRVAHLMEELVKYQPDLFIIYTGHNEFLEYRTYGKLKDIPPVVRSAVSLLAKTRTWSAMTAALQGLGIHPKEKSEDREQLRGEVNAILDRSKGLDYYHRDDRLKEDILEHYQISLERMSTLARSVGAKVIFVTPASNLKDFSPFKSEHLSGLDPAAQQRVEQMLTQAREAVLQEDWDHALDLLKKAVALDPRHAELQYRRGQALLAVGRNDEAETVLRLARDEDVCPLRALTPMREIVTEVARSQGTELVDYVGLVQQEMLQAFGCRIPGQEFFLDHVHPTIGGHKILAVALVRKMIEQGLLSSEAEWGDQSLKAVSAKIEGEVDQRAHAQALANLARVLLWAGKIDDAERLGLQALKKAGDDPKIAREMDTMLVKVFQKRGKSDRALELLYSIIAQDPAAIEPRYNLGIALLEDGPFMRLEEAAANLLLVCLRIPYDDAGFQYFGLVMAKRERLRIAYPSLREALRLNPKNTPVKNGLDQFPQLPSFPPLIAEPPTILLDVYPSKAPRRLVQVRRDANGRTVADGIEVEFHQNGRIKHFLDVDLGVPNGLEITWGPEGYELSRIEYKQGKVIETPGKES